MNKKIKYIIIFFISLSFLLTAYLSDKNFTLSDNINNVQVETQLIQTDPTEEFIKNLDITKYERNGTDYANPKYNPERIGKPLEEIDREYDFDFERLAQVEKKLEGIDRKKALKTIFDQVTKDAKTNLEKHLAIVKFLQKSSFHNDIQPTYPDKQPVYDPLVLLELNEIRCGHVARIGVDLFESAGYKGRLVQAGYHILAEIAYDNSYHYFEADLIGGGQTVIKNGKIPSVIELKDDVGLLDSLGSNYESAPLLTTAKESIPYPSYFYFYKKAYSSEPFYYQKIATNEEKINKWYGWNYFTTIHDYERTLIEDQPVYYIPGSINYQNILLKSQSQTARNILNLEWSESKDLDQDLLGYKIYIATKSRGWNNVHWQGEHKLKKFNHDLGSWKPEMYDSLFQEPPHDVLLLKTKETKATLELTKGKDYYITIMPYDQHGESVGRVLYPPSNEIKISL
jgi:hypothetical protein